ncbi:hypothetical protein AGDE_07512 [Angomonas deanei]|uniref:Pyridine nucleotide-disulphide oxidoreductase n=1 Tax=Angomonas deanei TaxID=59799 RepID=A0A7G2C7T6_9TRYP|nr:hypothetical protein AGDE_07512 [Angomonas deanei]CAD2215868.1 Domain of unknown function (DUF4821)/Pyridine nucleotide-disulphide oxidoreductase, putative [Angomonas deanei]|eukprot:EPY35251.1 hypothetical protein AGDE_07512 [Angomonas deanei]
MDSTCKIEGVLIRRSLFSDADDLAELMKMHDYAADGIPRSAVFGGGTKQFFQHLIETSSVTLTAVSSTPELEVVVGFAAFSIVPEGLDPIWETLLQENYSIDPKAITKDNTVEDILCTNTLWLNFMLCPPVTTHLTRVSRETNSRRHDWEAFIAKTPYDGYSLCEELLYHALGTQQHVAHLLCHTHGKFNVIENIGFAEQTPKSKGEGELYYAHRNRVLDKLHLRLGRIEDYDDFVPLLVKGTGVITNLPQDFYLEEILKDQNQENKVLVAETQKTHRLVGMACVRVLSSEEQQLISKRYQTDSFQKFAPVRNRSQTTSNLLLIDFLYFNPEYCFSVTDFIRYLYVHFPTHEYCAVCLPHDIEEPPFLHQFRYLPIRKYQPHNARGESLPIPDGLWVHCRYSLDSLSIQLVNDKNDVAQVEEFMDAPRYGLTPAVSTAFRESANSSLEDDEMAGNHICATLRWGPQRDIVGLASVQRMSVPDMYALRSNYDIDQFTHFNIKKGHDYSATTISLTSQDKKEDFYSEEMRGILVKSLYIIPAFDEGFRTFVSHLLRLCGAEMAVILVSKEVQANPSIAKIFIPAQPRRVVESLTSASGAADNEDSDVDDDVAFLNIKPLNTLLFATKRSLSDAHQRVNTRIVVVGASATGFAFLYRLLTVPYAHFTNIVLVSVDGLTPHLYQNANQWHTDQMEMLEREHSLLFTRQSIRVVTGALVDLDKVNKFVSVDNGVFEPYDYLVLTTGRQYITPPSIRTLQQQEGQSSRAGVIPLNSENAIDRLRQKLKELDRDANNVSNVVVYGSGLEAITVVNAILKEGFSPQRVVLCRPEEDVPDSMNYDAYQIVVNYFKHLGTSVLQGYDASRLEFDDENKLRTVVLDPVSHERAADSAIELNCSIIVCAETKDIDPNVLSTLNKRSIVFDGRVIVENNYRTTDPSVFAAGPVAMFTRRYGATESFDDFNAKDVGYHLAEVLMGFIGFDEFVDPKYHTSNPSEMNNGDKDNTLYTKVLEENGSKVAKHNNVLGEMTEEEALETLRRLPQYSSPLARRTFFLHDFVFSARAASTLTSTSVPPSPAGILIPRTASASSTTSSPSSLTITLALWSRSFTCPSTLTSTPA